MSSQTPAPAPARAPQPPALKLALEFGPLAIFFFANQRYGIIPATAALMVAVMVSLAVSWALTRRVPVMPLVTALGALVFGGLTLAFNDDLFIKLKPTILNTLFGAILLGGLALGKPLLPLIFDSMLNLTAEGWRKLTLRWGLFFFLLAALNEIVWRTQSTDFWVAFKVFGIMPLTFVFALSQVPLLLRHDAAPKEDGAG